jgi:pimeloyl-ACP methyl ester carboxylesterase
MGTFVLVHGSWHGAWCWERLVPRLQTAGHTVIAVDLPGYGEDHTPVRDITLQAYADKVLAVVDTAEEPVVLVGWSMGGIMISTVAEQRHERIAHLVYLAALMLPRGVIPLQFVQPTSTTATRPTPATQPGDGVVSAPVTMVELLAGFQLSQALYAVAKCEIATALVAGPRPIAELAEATGCHPEALRRLLRTLAGIGLFTHGDDGTVALTALGATLADGVPGSVRNLALTWMETHYAPFARLIDPIRTGAPAATVHNGQPIFDWLAGHPEQVTRFTAADIGGADGSLLAELLAADPDQSRRGIEFDLPHVVSAAPALLAKRGLSARILSGIAAAAAPGARLVVIEMVIPPGDEPHTAKSIDLTMLGMVTGKERTRAEFETLLTDAGFTLDRVLPESGGSPYSILEAVRV